MNSILRALLAFLALGLFPVGAAYEEDYKKLKTAGPTDQSQVAAAEHARALFNLSDTELERLVMELLRKEIESKRGDEESRKLFLAAHEKWKEFRSLEAEYLSDEARGGSIRRQLHSKHLDYITRDRIRRLNHLIPRRSMELGFPADRDSIK